MNTAQKTEFRRQIMLRAEELGMPEEIPDTWDIDGMLKTRDETELVAKAEQVLRDVRGLVPALTKADGEDNNRPDGEDETADIDGATAAIAAIAALIISEAQSLAEGNLNEACDIALLLQAVDALKWFKRREEMEDGPDGMELADSPDSVATPGERLLTKAEAAEAIKDAVAEALAAADEAKTSAAGEPQGITKADVAEMVKAAVAQAEAASEERIAAVEAANKALEADLAKANGELEAIKATPIPGGPVLTRTSAQIDTARKSDAEQMQAQAEVLLAKAEAFSANRDLAEGYRQRAKALLERAAA